MNEFQNDKSLQENNSNQVETLPEYGQPLKVGRGAFKVFWIIIINIILIVTNLAMAVISLSKYDTPYYCIVFVCMLLAVFPLMKFSRTSFLSGIFALILNLAVTALFIFVFCAIK